MIRTAALALVLTACAPPTEPEEEVMGFPVPMPHVMGGLYVDVVHTFRDGGDGLPVPATKTATMLAWTVNGRTFEVAVPPDEGLCHRRSEEKCREVQDTWGYTDEPSIVDKILWKTWYRRSPNGNRVRGTTFWMYRHRAGLEWCDRHREQIMELWTADPEESGEPVVYDPCKWREGEW